MVFEKLSIDCESIENKNEVFKVLNSIGYIGIGDHDDFLFVHTYRDGDYQTYYEHDNVKQLTYKQFMGNYSNKESAMNKQLMISIIDAAKKQLNLGNSELSLKLGHNRNYISRVLHQENPTPEQMTKVVDKVKALVVEQKELLPEFKHTPVVDAIMVSKDEYDSLKKELNHKNQVLDKRNDLYRKLELECKDRDEAIKLQLENVASKILAINELEVDIKHISEAHDILVNKKINLELQLKTTQQKFVDVVDQKDSEIKKLQNDCNHATNQYQGKREQVVRLNEKVKKQKLIYMIIIAILFIASIVGFSS